MLRDYRSAGTTSHDEVNANKEIILKTLAEQGPMKNISATVGPTVTLYEVVPDRGVKIHRIKSLDNDIALSLSALGTRIIAPIPGRGTVGDRGAQQETGDGIDEGPDSIKGIR